MNLIGYVLLFIGAAVFNFAEGAPLGPMQVLWLNVAIVVPAAIGLGYDVPSPGLMDKAARPRDDRVLKAPVLWWMFVRPRQGIDPGHDGFRRVLADAPRGRAREPPPETDGVHDRDVLEGGAAAVAHA